MILTDLRDLLASAADAMAELGRWLMRVERLALSPALPPVERRRRPRAPRARRPRTRAPDPDHPP